MRACSDTVRRLAGVLAVLAMVFGAALHAQAFAFAPSGDAAAMSMDMAGGQCPDGERDGTQQTMCHLLCAGAAAILPAAAAAAAKAQAAPAILPPPARLEHRAPPDPFPPRFSARA